VLIVAAERLRSAVRGHDRIGRIGGDEFLVICPRMENVQQARNLGTRIAEALRGTVDVGVGEAHLQASVGVAWTNTPIDADALIAQADGAMYECKRGGVGGVAVYSPPMTAAL
jgi:diguanylate cyclase (GGDEF)-like protein